MPLKNQLHVDQLLSNVSIKYKNDMYIASEMLPEVPVKKDSDLYRVFDRDFRLPETIRANRGVAREASFDITTSTYVLVQHSLKDYVSDRDAENYDAADLRADTTEYLTDKILLRMEKEVAQLFVNQTTTGNTNGSWSQAHSLSAAQQWSADTTTSNPIPQMDTASTVILEGSGQVANYAMLPHRCLIAAKNHSSVIDRVKYTSADITPAMIAGLFDVPQLLIGKAVLDSAVENATSTSIAPVWGDNVFVGYKPAKASPLAPSCGYIFRNNIPMVKRWRVEERQSEAIEVNVHFQAKVVASLSGYLLKDVLA
jgi:hypothetical protein